MSIRSGLDEPSPTYGCPATTVTPDANGWVPLGTCGYLARPYYPSFIATLVFSAAAAAVLIGFGRRIVSTARRQKDKSKSSWRIGLRLPVVGGFVSTCLLTAYVLRAFGTRYQQVPFYVGVSDTLVLVCPILVFAFDCVVLIRIMKAFFPEEKAFLITARTLSRSLLVIISLLTVEQLLASVLIAPKHRPSPSRPSSSTAMLGLKLYLVGLGIQKLVAMYTFTLAVIIHRLLICRTTESPKTIASKLSDQAAKEQRRVSYALLFSFTAITARTTYRLIELSGFFTGYLLFLAHHEVFFYALECLPVLAAIGVWAFVDPDGLMKEPSSRGQAFGTYDYHEISRELADDDYVPLLRVGAEE